MKKEVKSQAKVGVGMESMWKALAQDMRFIIPQVVPNLVKDMQIIEGDDVPHMSYQKEKIVELDESVHRLSLQVVEGGHLNLGFSSYITTFQLTAIGEQESAVDIIVAYESQVEETTSPSKTTASALGFIKCLENYLLNGSASQVLFISSISENRIKGLDHLRFCC